MEATVFLLLGGESRRMGQDKAKLLYRGQPFWQQLAERLCAVGQVVLSSRREIPNSPYPCVTDCVENCGPLGGMLSCLLSCETPLAFFCACDMPLLDADMLRYLYRALDAGTQAVIPVDCSGRAQPLCGLYRRELAPLVRRQLDSGALRLHQLLERCAVRYCPLENEPALACQLRNINTPSDYQALLAQTSETG